MQWGVNLAANWWWSFQNSPGQETWTIPDFQPYYDDCAYLHSKNLGVIRLPVMWPRLQQSLFGELDSTHIAALDTIIDAAVQNNLIVVISPHGYGRYQPFCTDYSGWAEAHDNEIGSPAVPVTAFADFWARLANRYKNNPNVLYGLMNEPHRMGPDHDGNDPIGGGELWAGICQIVVDAIRQVDPVKTIVVPGYGWSSARLWVNYGNDYLLNLTDNNLVFECHQYLDQPDSAANYGETCEGPFVGAVSPDTVGEERLQPFVDWLRTNGKKGVIGEMGVPPTTCWLDIFDNALHYISQNTDVLDYFIYFIAGSGVEANNPIGIRIETDASGSYIDKPQMTVLSNYTQKPAAGMTIVEAVIMVGIISMVIKSQK